MNEHQTQPPHILSYQRAASRTSLWRTRTLIVFCSFVISWVLSLGIYKAFAFEVFEWKPALVVTAISGTLNGFILSAFITLLHNKNQKRKRPSEH